MSHYPSTHGVRIRIGAPYYDIEVPGTTIDLSQVDYQTKRSITTKLIQYLFPGTDYGTRQTIQRTRNESGTGRIQGRRRRARPARGRASNGAHAGDNVRHHWAPA